MRWTRLEVGTVPTFKRLKLGTLSKVGFFFTKPNTNPKTKIHPKNALEGPKLYEKNAPETPKIYEKTWPQRDLEQGSVAP